MTAPSHPELLDPMRLVLVKVAGVARETNDTFTVTTEAAESEGLPRFEPGQFSMLYSYGVGEAPISISGDPHDPSRLVYTIRSVGAVSKALVSRAAGDSISMRGPFGTSWPVQAAEGRDVLLVAGGIGLAPLRTAIYHILRRRTKYGRLMILYGARSPKELLFRKELRTWASFPDTQVLTTVDYGSPSWRGNVGVVTKLFRSARIEPERTLVLMCGPEIMMRFAVRDLQARKIADERIYLSMERNMKCAAGFCGHCQMGPYFVCKDGPVFSYARMRRWMGGLREL
ncbi:MAG TPA: FAD/NAD(P)-binding protein [Bryobacteraceae bacterium]|nr:FAD/NAD(P)-binding protein [Bryobacteraceae bacterium]